MQNRATRMPMVESSVDVLTSADLLPLVEADASPIFRMFPSEARPPSRLGAYELLFELASGGMATVFLARRAGLGGFSRFVAIKRLRREVAQAPPFLAMLIDEARLAARIHHPNVAATLEFASEGADDYYLVMEYVEGGSLLDLVTRAAEREEVLPPRVVLRVVLDALAGLHAAHETTDDLGRPLDLVHRDLSPHNLMVGLDGCTRVVDFGLARAASRLTKTDVGTLKGKLAYMAPEQLHQRPIDRRADVFSLGVVLWEGLRGERLFRAETDVATIERVLRGEIPSLRSHLPWLSHGVNAVVMKALARDPERRWQTAEELAQALHDATEATNLLGSRREVGACVARLLGDDLARRRDRVRSWIATHEPDPQPTVTQLCFAAAREEDAPEEDVSMDRASLCAGVETQSLVPSSQVIRDPRRRRSYAPLVAGAAIGLSAIAVALAARSGAELPGLGSAPELGASPPAAMKSDAPLSPTPSPTPAPADEAAPATSASEILARPETRELPAPTSSAHEDAAPEAPPGEIVARPEPRSAPAKQGAPRSAGHRGSSRRASSPPAGGAPTDAPPRDLDNPYR